MSATVARPARGLPVLVVVFVVLALTGSLRADDLLVSGFTSDNVVRYHPISGGPLGTLQPGSGLDGAQSVTTGPDGRLYVCSENTNRVLRYERSTGAFVDVFVNPGNGLNAPTGAIFGPDSTGDGHPDLYVASFNGDSVLLYDGADGSFVSVFVSPGSGGLNGPDAGIAFGPDGHLYVPSYWNDRVLRYDGATGAFLGAFVGPGSGGLVRPRVVRFRPSDGRVVVSSEGSNKV
ncbi:MAG: NHL repeat-containing protein, partial [Planctomycetota bacterium]